MGKVLVAYFSASGKTAKAAKNIADAMSADLFEIEPSVKYTSADLNYRDPKSRSSLERENEDCRPEIVDKPLKLDAYDTIFLGFPIWWYVAPRIINTFLETYNFAGKKIILFATSGSSGFGKTKEGLMSSAPGAVIMEGKILTSTSPEEIAAWAQTNE